MDVASLLIELFGRIPPLAHHAVRGMPLDMLTERPGQDANTVAWLVWHLARVQDSHVAELIDGADQLYAAGDWAARFGLPADPHDTGYGHTSAQVADVRPRDAAVLTEYLDAVAARTETWLASLTPADLDRVVDDHWDPPVTLGVRLVSIADDCLEHAGQAAFVRGMLGG